MAREKPDTFSKTSLMPGWRLDWLMVPPGLTADLGELIKCNTSCVPVFVQQAGVAALKEGEPVIARTLEHFRRACDALVAELNRIPRVSAVLPSGTLYVFFRIEGVGDSLDFCTRLVRDAGLGLAPGSALSFSGAPFWIGCTVLVPRSDGTSAEDKGIM